MGGGDTFRISCGLRLENTSLSCGARHDELTAVEGRRASLPVKELQGTAEGNGVGERQIREDVG